MDGCTIHIGRREAYSEEVWRADCFEEKSGGSDEVVSRVPETGNQAQTSDIRLIMEEQRREREASLNLGEDKDPVKEFEAEKLYALQKDHGFIFNMADEETKRNLILMEYVDQKKRMVRESRIGDQ